MDHDEHLSQIQTLWSVVRRAHGQQVIPEQLAQESDDVVRKAQQALVNCYGGAARRYLLAAVRNEDTAAELFQEFALRFLRGDFRNADPEKGRFRSFLKTVLYRMIVDYQRGIRRGPTPQLPDERMTPLAAVEPDEQGEAFLQSWREDMLSRTWKALEQEQQESDKPVYDVLRFRVDHPDLRSPELAEGLSRQLGREISAANVRVMLHRARERFAHLLLDQVAQSLEDPSREALEAELIELELLDYCRPALDARD
jgi:RNA polymerase sigma factor (sigma-70 family)